MIDLSGDKFMLVQGDDWEGLYLNGVLFDEEHKIGNRLLVGYMNIHKTLHVEFSSLNDQGNEWIQHEGNLPQLLNDIPLEFLI